MKGKFGRVLGDFILDTGERVTELMAAEGHCVPYYGGSKDETQAQHMANRVKLLDEGVVTREDYAAAVALME